jgi:hypothetical protein
MSTITSAEWTDFLTKIKQAKNNLGSPERLWYRGHPNSDFYLLASLNRFENGFEKEQYLFNSFQKFSERLLKRRESEWETLFDMQHYHIPTRLLDWSETFGIALFFASYYNQSHHPGKDAAIYLLNPEALNRISNVPKVYRIPEDEEHFSYKKIYWEHRPFSPSAPIAIEPIFINDRMLAQRGMFTVHDDSIDPIENKFPNAVQKVVLPNSLMSAALEFLDLSNITQYTVFPDLAGIAGFLMNTSELKHRW